MKTSGVEGRRKAVHIGMAGFALFLPALGWKGSAAAAAVAFAFNLVILPRLAGRSLSRESDAGSRVPLGILLYPVTVLLLILLFRERLELAAAGWAFLAFGDGMATIAGQAAAGGLPWNPRKSAAGMVAYVVAGGVGAALLYRWVAGRALSRTEFAAILLGALAGAVLESLPSELDDNLLPPIGGALVTALFVAALPGAGGFFHQAGFLRWALLALAVNTVLPLLAVLLRAVRPSGALAGGLYGTLILTFGGWRAYALLWAFFAAGTVATRFGRKRKEALGKAEEAGGRRGAANVAANVTVPLVLFAAAAFAGEGRLAACCQLAAAAALATALMDTIGTEVGQAVGGATFLLPDLKAVPPGTDGAVSLAGTVAGLLAADAVGLLFVVLYGAPFAAAVAIAAAACFGTIVESLLGRAGARWRVSNGHVLNLTNTAAGAGLAWVLAARPFAS